MYQGETIWGPEIMADSWEEALDLVRGRFAVIPAEVAEEDYTPKITTEDLAHYVYSRYPDRLKLKYNWDRNTFWGAIPELTSDTNVYIEISEKQMILTSRFGGTIKIFTEYATKIFEIEAELFNRTRANQEQINKMAIAIGLMDET